MLGDARTLMLKGRELRKILDEAWDVVFDMKSAEPRIPYQGDYFRDLSEAIAKVLIKVDELFIMSSERP